MAAGVSISAALSGLKANFGADLAATGCCGDDFRDSGDVVGGDVLGRGWSVGVDIDDAGAGSFLGGAGGTWSVSGRFVSRSEFGTGDCGTIVCFGCSWVDTERARRQ